MNTEYSESSAITARTPVIQSQLSNVSSSNSNPIRSNVVQHGGPVQTIHTIDISQIKEQDYKEVEDQCGRCDFMAFLAAASEFSKLEDADPMLFTSNFEIEPTDSKLESSGASAVVHAAGVYRRLDNFGNPRADKAERSPVVVKRSSQGRRRYFEKNGRHVSRDDKEVARSLIFEARVLSHESLRKHPNITEDSVSMSIPSPQLVLEYAPHHNLSDLLKANKHLSYPIRRKICTDVRDGLRALHLCDIIHRDVKLENVLIFSQDSVLSRDCVAKLADFRHSFLMTRNSTPEQSSSGKFVSGGLSIGGHSREKASARDIYYRRKGTPLYAPPEYEDAISSSEYILSDLYSYGILVWFVMLGFDAFLDFVHGKTTSPMLAEGLELEGYSPEVARDRRIAYVQEMKKSDVILQRATEMLSTTESSIITFRGSDIELEIHKVLQCSLSRESSSRNWNFLE
ncbi:hypothetical protein TWF506_011482 [Arthrobotrys conoides]|uniref:Protein kinase domain-containing protein n=1 Tax=Arthrobotrys conoides TaxID=74498 RepID=A0AAN8N7K0_9PEZI